jgi:soluble lytic murein transglycosylase-like protein
VNSAAVNDAASAKPDTAPRAVLDPKAQDAKAMLREAARRSGLPPEFVESVARVESGLRQDAVSPKGAIGVMQLMPGTAKTLGADPHDAAQNIDAGTRLLRELLLKYDGDVIKALAAYNAGEGAVERYQGMPPYNETRWYVKKVIDGYQKSAGQ